MATVRDTEEVEKEIFEVVGKWEESVLRAGRTWAKSVGDVMPVDMPVVRELVKGVFDFTEEVLKAQREFAHSMLRVTRPVGRPRATRATPVHTTRKAA